MKVRLSLLVVLVIDHFLTNYNSTSMPEEVGLHVFFDGFKCFQVIGFISPLPNEHDKSFFSLFKGTMIPCKLF